MLKKKIFTNISYNIFSQILSFIGGMILARLLFPEDYGVFSISFLIIEFATCLSLSSFAVSLIQKKQVEDIHYSSLCILSLTISIILMIILASLSEQIALFFNMSILAETLRIHIFALPVISLELLFNPLLVKELKFKELGVAELGFTLGNAFVAIVFALLGYGIFSLVIGYIVGKIARLSIYVFYIGLHRFKLLNQFSMNKFKDLFFVGAGITCQNVFLFITYNIDYILLGKLASKSQLGFYQRAYRLISLPVFQISQSMSRVLLPAFAREQDDNQSIVTKLNIVTQFSALMIFPSFTFVFCNAEFLISMVFGEKWLPSVIPLKILIFAGAIKSVSTFLGDALKAKGAVFHEFFAQFIQAGILFVGGYFAIKYYGMSGIACVVIISSGVFWILMICILKHIIALNIYEYLKNLLIVLILCFIGFFYHSFLTSIYYKYYSNEIIHFLLSLAGCITIYVCFVFFNLRYFLIKDDIIKVIEKIRRLKNHFNN